MAQPWTGHNAHQACFRVALLSLQRGSGPFLFSLPSLLFFFLNRLPGIKPLVIRRRKLQTLDNCLSLLESMAFIADDFQKEEKDANQTNKKAEWGSAAVVNAIELKKPERLCAHRVKARSQLGICRADYLSQKLQYRSRMAKITLSFLNHGAWNRSSPNAQVMSAMAQEVFGRPKFL